MKLKSFAEGIGVGLFAAYFLDPDRGGRRRAVLRDKIVHQGIRKRECMQIMARDFVNRSRGMRYRIQQRFDHASVEDQTLVERMRSELGRQITHLSAIDIQCENGTVTLSGPILASEIQDCMWHARMVPGVKHVINRLEPHASKENLPELQGGISAAVNHRWNPATSLVMGVAGVLLTAYGSGRKGLTGTAFQVLGVGMVAKAFHDTEHRFEPSTRKAISKQKSMSYDVPSLPSEKAAPM